MKDFLAFYQTNRLYIFPVMITLASLVLIIFVIYPQAVKFLSNKQMEGEIFNQSQVLEAKAQTLESYNPDDLNRQLNFAVSSYPTDKDFVTALALLQNLVSQAGFTTLSMTLGEGSQAVQNTATQSYLVKVDISGSTASLSSLLTSIENSPRLMKVSTVEVSAGRDTSTISLNIEVLYSPTSGSLGSTDSPLPEFSQKDQEIISKLSRSGLPIASGQETSQPALLGPRGKSNPFE